MAERKHDLGSGAGPTARDPWHEALRVLARRPLTEAELRDRLARACPDADADGLVERLRSARYLDDFELALNYIAARAPRLAQGGQRLRRDLEQRGVSSATALRAWNHAVDLGDVEPDALLREAVRRKLGGSDGGPFALDDRRYRRVYNALLRAGFDASAVIEALRPHRARAERSGRDILHDFDDHELNDEGC